MILRHDQEDHDMTDHRPRPGLFSAFRHYAGKLQTFRDDMRLTHFMYSLPEDLRKDIGWPDFKADRCQRGK